MRYERLYIAVPIQIILRGVGARQCRALRVYLREPLYQKGISNSSARQNPVKPLDGGNFCITSQRNGIEALTIIICNNFSGVVSFSKIY